MKALKNEVILHVNNIDSCRIFYREIVGFGQPVLDSNFRCEFEIPSHQRLILKEESGQTTPQNRTEWSFASMEPQALALRIHRYGFRTETLSDGSCRCFDPEGNPFVIHSIEETQQK